MRTTSEAERHEARRAWMTTKDVADRFGVSTSQVRRLVKNGHLRAFNAGMPDGERCDWRFRAEWVDEYLMRQTKNGAA